MARLLKSLVETLIAVPAVMVMAVTLGMLAMVLGPIYFLVAIYRECQNERA